MPASVFACYSKEIQFSEFRLLTESVPEGQTESVIPVFGEFRLLTESVPEGQTESVIPVFGEFRLLTESVPEGQTESVIHVPNSQYGLRGRKATFAESVALEGELLISI